jgi:hypothetical protein
MPLGFLLKIRSRNAPKISRRLAFHTKYGTKTEFIPSPLKMLPIRAHLSHSFPFGRFSEKARESLPPQGAGRISFRGTIHVLD